MIYHFFSAKHIHLSPSIIQSILTNAHLTNTNGKEDICIVVEDTSGTVFEGKDKITPYTELAKRNNFNNLRIVHTKINLLSTIFKISSKDKILFHSSLNREILVIVNTIIHIFRLKKKALSINYVCWGGDFGYSINRTYKNPVKRFLNRIYDQVFTWYGNIITLDKSDEDKAKNIFGSNNIKTIPYLSNRNILTNSTKQTSPIRIMVSHSGWRHNHHFESFKLLEKFKSYDIEIICPLCYGESEYIQEVIAKGKSIFGSKFKYFTELKSRQEYSDFIASNHIYITATETQTGLGAINLSLVHNVKVFVKDFLYNQYIERGYPVFNFNNLINMTFNDLKAPLDEVNLKKIIEVKQIEF